MRLRPTTVRARLTLWYTLFLSVPLIAFAIVSFLIFSRTLQSRTDAFIGDALTVFAREVVAERRHLPNIVAAIRTTVHEVRFRELDIVVLDETGNVVAVSAPLNEADQLARAFPADSSIILATLRRDDRRQARATT
ncbi:MAG: hypothetical protein ACREMQ_09665, partial [Longimicrobiales bacterium]